jgi:hypothetical protein
MFTVQSTLRFLGQSRPDGNQLVPADRGLYSCAFENEVKIVESSMQLRIERKSFKFVTLLWMRQPVPKACHVLIPFS